jgi:hypothetical protein
MTKYIRDAVGSKWGNPFNVVRYGREESVEMYKDYLHKSGLIRDIEEVRGKVLGCWCNPECCHGDILLSELKKIDAQNFTFRETDFPSL